MLITAVLLRLTTFDAATTAAYVCMFTAFIPALVTATFARIATRVDFAAFLRRLLAGLPARSQVIAHPLYVEAVIALETAAQRAQRNALSRVHAINARRRLILHGAPHIAAHRAHFAAYLAAQATS